MSPLPFHLVTLTHSEWEQALACGRRLGDDALPELRLDLFPEADETHFHNALLQTQGLPLEAVVERAAQGMLQPTLRYAKSLFGELTDRWFSLQSMGLATVEEEPIMRYLFGDFPDVGLAQDEVHNLFRTWLRVQLERRCFLPPGGVIVQRS